MSDAPLVLHISADYPNVYRPENTLAVKNLIVELSQINHVVFAVTRTSNPFKVKSQMGDGSGDARVVSVRYWGLPFGIFLQFSMWLLGLRILRLTKKMDLKPDLIHAHKLTFEGIASWYLSKWLNTKWVCSVRGEAESKIIKFKPHYKYLLNEMLKDVSKIYYVSAWFKPILNSKFDIASDKEFLLPNFVKAQTTYNYFSIESNHFVTVLDLNVYRKKGLDNLLSAFSIVSRRNSALRLDIVGRSNPSVLIKISKMISDSGLEDKVKYIGVLSNDALINRLQNYAGLLLPSHNETFGMVYVEALLSGIPILHSVGTGIDGFVDFVSSRVAVEPLSIDQIAAGIEEITEKNQQMKDWLKINRSRVLDHFSSASYIKLYMQNFN